MNRYETPEIHTIIFTAKARSAFGEMRDDPSNCILFVRLFCDRYKLDEERFVRELLSLMHDAGCGTDSTKTVQLEST